MSNLQTLQAYFKAQNIDAMIVLHDDMFAGEYLAPADERLAWATGFTGSAGLAIITQNKALLLTDSRYTLQAQTQALGCDVLEQSSQPFLQILTWLRDNMPAGATLAFDPWLFAQKRLENWQTQLKDTDFNLVPLKKNPIDLLWQNRPSINPQKFWQHPIACAGVSTEDKIKNLDIKKPMMITDMASVNWLLNIRGGGVPYTPGVQAFALLTPQGDITLFIDLQKVPSDLPPYIKCVALSDLTNFDYPKNLQADAVSVPAALWQYWQDKKIDVQLTADPCYMPRTIKNPAELAGAAQAHINDGVAVIKFLYWFAQQHARTDLTECDVADKIQSFRAQQVGYYSDSFATIAGAGPNGAIVHYKPEPATCRTLQTNELLLLDSGAQYNKTDNTPNFCGTTDITRVLWFGQNAPTSQAKNYYTMVLKAHIAAASAVFPAGTTGAQIDALARAPLWACGQNFGHGLGHGVGSFASVHDGAVGLSPKSQGVLVPSLLITIEPGIYLESSLGVRLENVYQVVLHTQYKDMLAFTPLTLVPFDVALIDIAQLSQAEKTWLNNYHAQVLATLAPLLDGAELAWFKEACMAI